MGSLALHQVLGQVFGVVAEANRYFAGQEPWQLRKTDPARMATVLYVTAEVLRVIGILCQPFVPAGASKLLDLLEVEDHVRDFAHVRESARLIAGTPLPAPSGIFPRYVEAVEDPSAKGVA